MTKQYIRCQIIFSSSSASIPSQDTVSRIESPPWKCLFALLRTENVVASGITSREMNGRERRRRRGSRASLM